MKTIVNKTQKPLRVPLSSGSILHLGPGKSGQIADDAVDLPGVRKLIQSGAIALSGEAAATSGPGQETPQAHEVTHGHQPTKVVLPKGDR